MSAAPSLPPCPLTGKISHATKRDAEARVKQLTAAKGGRWKRYRCQLCMFWHVSKGQRGRPGKAR